MNDSLIKFTQPATRLLIASLFLFLIGTLAIYSSSFFKSIELYASPTFFIKKHVLVFFISLIIGWVILKLPKSFLNKTSPYLFYFSLFLLSLVIIPGAYKKIGGAKRWINFIIVFQPIELLKISMILYYSKILCENSRAKAYLKIGISLLIISLFLLLQPDFGSLVLILSVAGVMLFLAGIAPKLLYGISSATIFAGSLAIYFSPYRLRRVLTFLDPWSDRTGSGYQTIQSFLALKNGNMTGLGLGESKQKLLYLPEAHNDYILAVVGEELGIIGLVFVLVLISTVVYYGAKSSYMQNCNYNRYVSTSLVFLFFFQSFFNISVVLGLLPPKGIGLPLVSYGSTSLLTFSCIIAIIIRCSLQDKEA